MVDLFYIFQFFVDWCQRQQTKVINIDTSILGLLRAKIVAVGIPTKPAPKTATL